MKFYLRLNIYKPCLLPCGLNLSRINTAFRNLSYFSITLNFVWEFFSSSRGWDIGKIEKCRCCDRLCVKIVILTLVILLVVLCEFCVNALQ